MYTNSTSCLGCGGPPPAAFLNLGETPLANSYVSTDRADQPEAVYPLAVGFCPRCFLVQLTGTVSPEDLFSQYAYFSSYSTSFLQHAEEMAHSLQARFELGSKSHVLEIASNDGYLLQYFMRLGVPCLGVEPAANIAQHAQEKGIPTINSFFNAETAETIRKEYGLADVIIGNNVLAHVPEINEFLGAVRMCLALKGSAVFEFPYLASLLDHFEFDTIYHEHVFYYSLAAIDVLARRAGLILVDAEFQPVHGGTMRVFLEDSMARTSPSSRLKSLLLQENAEGLTGPSRFKRFGEKVRDIKHDLVELLSSLRSDGQRVAAYGAPAKGNTLLNYCGITPEQIEFTVDRNPHKQGRLLPGSHIPILDPAELLRRQPDYAVILPWNIAGEVMEQQRGFVERGGRFILPIPKPEVVIQPEPVAAARM